MRYVNNLFDKPLGRPESYENYEPDNKKSEEKPVKITSKIIPISAEIKPEDNPSYRIGKVCPRRLWLEEYDSLAEFRMNNSSFEYKNCPDCNGLGRICKNGKEFFECEWYKEFLRKLERQTPFNVLLSKAREIEIEDGLSRVFGD